MTGLFSDLMRKIWIGEKTEEANIGLEVNGIDLKANIHEEMLQAKNDKGRKVCLPSKYELKIEILRWIEDIHTNKEEVWMVLN